MARVAVRVYSSPTLALLAFDWPDAPDHQDFLGFQIVKTSPDGTKTTLLNRLTFAGVATHGDVPSSAAPIQKFDWWDASIPPSAAGAYTYTVTPVLGVPDELKPLDEASGNAEFVSPTHVVNGVGSWFNRAVVSSQAFSALLVQMGLTASSAPTPEQEKKLRGWLANGLETVVPDFLANASSTEGAIYHLTDNIWIVPALREIATPVDLVYDSHLVYNSKTHTHKPSPNQPTIDALKANPKVTFEPRDATNIMHDKFLVNVVEDSAKSVLCGSMNFTSEGISTQANLLHTFDCPELATLFLERKRLIQRNLSIADTAPSAKWSDPIQFSGASIRVFFSPEPTKSRESVSEIISAIEAARSSVVFCLFDPTDIDLLNACFDAGDAGKMMFGLVNHISRVDPSTNAHPQPAAISIYHRNRNNHDVVGPDAYGRDNTPQGFLPESTLFPGEHGRGYAPVIIHHKFVVIDGETDSPAIYSGSQNISNNSLHKNDEALLEIKGSPRLGQLYLAEFLRLYENYRARAKLGGMPSLALAKDGSWCKKYFVAGSPEAKSRVAMAAPPGAGR